MSKILNENTFEFFKEDNKTQEEKLQMMFEKLRHIQPLTKSVKDFYNAALNWRFY